MYIVATFVEKEYQENEDLRQKYGDYVFYSSSMLFKPKKGMVGHYRKMNPWLAVDKSFMTAGSDLLVYDTEYGRISISVCFDIMTCLPLVKKHNVWAHFHSFAWVDAKAGQPVNLAVKKQNSEQWDGNWFRAGLPGKLFNNAGGFYFVGANWSVDQPENWTGFGYPSIYNPEGIVISQGDSSYGTDYVVAELDPPSQNPPPPFPLYE